jgi:hypothetical protein
MNPGGNVKIPRTCRADRARPLRARADRLGAARLDILRVRQRCACELVEQVGHRLHAGKRCAAGKRRLIFAVMLKLRETRLAVFSGGRRFVRSGFARNLFPVLGVDQRHEHTVGCSEIPVIEIERIGVDDLAHSASRG